MSSIAPFGSSVMTWSAVWLQSHSARLAFTSTPRSMSHRTPSAFRLPPKVQRDGISPVGTDARGILVEHRFGQVVAFEVQRGDEIELCAGRLEQREDAWVRFLLGGGGQRRRPGRIGGVRVRPQIEQEPDDRRPIHRCGVMQRSSAVLVAAHACIQQGRIAGDKAPHVVGAAEGDGGPHVEFAPARSRYSATSSRTRRKHVAQPSTPT